MNPRVKVYFGILLILFGLVTILNNFGADPVTIIVGPALIIVGYIIATSNPTR